MSNFRRPAATLLRLALALAPGMVLAAEGRPEAGTGLPGGATLGGAERSGGLAPLSELGAGKAAIGAGRQVIVQGQLDLDVLQHDNYTDGDGGQSDSRGYGTMRAELGLNVKLDERAQVVIAFGYRADLGDYGTNNRREELPATPGPDSSQFNSAQSQVVLKDAFVNLKEFLGFEELGVIAGRMPVSWFLVNDRGAFLFDSRADDPAIGSWDGARASYSGWDVMLLSPWVYRLPDASTLWGVTLDWKPATAGGDRVLVTATYAEQRNAILPQNLTAEKLQTVSGGLDWRSGELGFWVEAAGQKGNGLGGVTFEGFGGETGLDWQFSQYGKGRFQIIGGYQTGDDPGSSGSFEGFVNEWETIGDTLIVEHEKYGELSELMVGNLMSIKARWGIGFDERDSVRLDLTAAHYVMHEPIVAGGDTSFGTEFDAALRWQYTYNAQIRLFGALFKPGDGLADAQEASAAAATPPRTITAGDDMIWLMGANLNVSF